MITVTNTAKNPLSFRRESGRVATFPPGESKHPADVIREAKATGLGRHFGSVLKASGTDLDAETVEPESDEDPRLAMHWRTAVKEISEASDRAELEAWLGLEKDAASPRASVVSALEERLASL